MIDINKGLNWEPSSSSIQITTIDAHAAGEPLRVILDGFPKLEGKTIVEKRKFAKENFDHIRKSLMWEPRGHADMYGCIITEPEREDSDFGVLFTHNEGFSTMCGHGIIAVTKTVLETGMIEKTEPTTTIKIDSPAGLITSHAKIENGEIMEIYFENVPSFVYMKNQKINVESLGEITFDIAFGGAFYAFVDADKLGIEMSEENYRNLIEKGMLIKNAVMQKFEILHPFDEELSFLYGTIFTGKAHGDSDSRNVCIFADGEVDRSPTGTGVSARMAIHYFNNDLALNDKMVIESLIGSKFIASPIKQSKFDKYDAVIPRVSGTASITGKNKLIIDPSDNLKDGFILR